MRPPVEPALTVRPDPAEYAPYYARYITAVPDGPIADTLALQFDGTRAAFQRLGEAGAEQRPAPDKWTPKETLGHLVDTERIFAYRALRIGRGDATPLPGFEQDGYVATADFAARTLDDLLDEWTHLRAANVVLFRSFGELALGRWGTASGHPITARAAIWIVAGHELHHRRLLSDG